VLRHHCRTPLQRLENEFNLLAHKFAEHTVSKWLEMETMKNELYMMMTMSIAMNLFTQS
jgi:hypothetical protein